jgi:hypothetical protein
MQLNRGLDLSYRSSFFFGNVPILRDRASIVSFELERHTINFPFTLKRGMEILTSLLLVHAIDYSLNSSLRNVMEVLFERSPCVGFW